MNETPLATPSGANSPFPEKLITANENGKTWGLLTEFAQKLVGRTFTRFSLQM